MKEKVSEPIIYKIYVSDFAPDKLERNYKKMQIIQKRLATSRKKMFGCIEVGKTKE